MGMLLCKIVQKSYRTFAEDAREQMNRLLREHGIEYAAFTQQPESSSNASQSDVVRWSCVDLSCGTAP